MYPRSANQRSASIGQDALAYADTLFNLARYLTGNSADAEDLVQETYARAMRGAAQFEPGTNLKAWLFRILRNTWLSLARRRRIDPIVGGLDTVAPAAALPAKAAALRDDAELDCLRKLVAEDIERALMQLTEDARTIVLLDLEGLTEGEVAAVVGCAVGTVKSRLARARQALRRPAPGLRAMNGSAMDCSEARLHLLDDQRGRLDIALAGPLAAHLADCAACARGGSGRAPADRAARAPPSPARGPARAQAPARRRVGDVSARSAACPARTRRTAVLAAVGLVALLGAVALAVWVGQPPEADRLVAEAVTDHLRLLARADALEVRSGDVHQLRPWLTSRLDFAPVIPFAGDAEFPLRGGTIEYFLDRRAAAAVYGRRLHAITLLVVGRVDDLGWPAPGPSADDEQRAAST